MPGEGIRFVALNSGVSAYDYYITTEPVLSTRACIPVEVGGVFGLLSRRQFGRRVAGTGV
jgi:hypothetical protein